jgi:hypothetical protein
MQNQPLLHRPTLVPRSQSALRVALVHAALGACLMLLVDLARAPLDSAQRARGSGGGAALAAQAASAAASRMRGAVIGGDAGAISLSGAASGAAARRVAALAALSDALAEEGDALRAELRLLREGGGQTGQRFLIPTAAAPDASAPLQVSVAIAPAPAAPAAQSVVPAAVQPGLALPGAPAVAGPAPAAQAHAPLPSSGSSCTSAPLRPTSFTSIARGFVCFENLYVHSGGVKILLPPQPSQDFLTFISTDAPEAKIDVMSAADAAALAAAGPLPSISSAHVMFEWRQNQFLAHSGHFVEAVASALFLEAATGLPLAEVVLCSGCDASRKYNENGIVGENGLNSLVVEAIWAGAPLARTEEINSSDTSLGDLPSSVAAQAWDLDKAAMHVINNAARARTPLAPPAPPHVSWCERKPGPLPRGRLPRAMHIARACASSRQAAHHVHDTSVNNNFNWLLIAQANTGVQERIDAALARMRASPLLADVVFAPDALDITGVSFASTLARRPERGEPLIVAIQRTNRRSINDASFAELVSLLRTKYSTRVLAVRMELLTPRQQLRLASEADVLVGVQGNGLSHLLWQKRGSAVFEIFPHVSGLSLQNAASKV